MSPLEIEALGLSLKVAAACVIFSLPFGLAAAGLLAARDFPGRGRCGRR